jgi:hypothetical protein
MMIIRSCIPQSNHRFLGSGVGAAALGGEIAALGRLSPWQFAPIANGMLLSAIAPLRFSISFSISLEARALVACLRFPACCG